MGVTLGDGLRRRLLRGLKGVNRDGWGFIIYNTTSSPDATLSPTPSAAATDTPASPSPDAHGLSERAIAKVQEWVEYFLDKEPSPAREQLKEHLRWTIVEMPGADMPTIRQHFKSHMAALNAPSADDPDIPQVNRRVPFIIDEEATSSIFQYEAASNMSVEYSAASAVVKIFDPDYDGKPRLLDSAMSRGPRPDHTFPVPNALYYIGSRKESPMELTKLFSALVGFSWNYDEALPQPDDTDEDECIVSSAWIIAKGITSGD